MLQTKKADIEKWHSALTSHAFTPTQESVQAFLTSKGQPTLKDRVMNAERPGYRDVGEMAE